MEGYNIYNVESVIMLKFWCPILKMKSYDEDGLAIVHVAIREGVPPVTHCKIFLDWPLSFYFSIVVDVIFLCGMRNGITNTISLPI